MRNQDCILENPKLLRKFCQAMDRTYGCHRAFGTSRDGYGECKTCPLATAEQAMWLVKYKGMTMGEAVKATYRVPVSYAEAKEIIREAVAEVAGQSEPYLKDNEERAAAAVTLGEARDGEGD